MKAKHRISLIIREALDERGIELPWYETDRIAEVLLDSPDLIIETREP